MKKISLQQVLRMAVIIVSTIIIAFLAILSGYSFVQYQNSIKAKINSYLYESCDSISTSLSNINSEMYDIYSYDENFKILQSSTGLDSMTAIYNLTDRLMTLQKMKKKTVGYIVFYDNFESKRYYFDQKDFDVDEIEKIKEIAYAVANGTTPMHDWYFKHVGNHNYAMCLYHYGNIALCEFYLVSEIEDYLLEQVNIKDSLTFLINGEKILGDEDVVKAFSGISTANTDIFGGYSIYKKRIDGSDLTLVVAVPINFLTLINLQQIILVLATIATLLVTLFFYSHMKKQLLNPLNQLIEDMNRIGNGQLDTKILSKSRFSEIQTVIDTTDHMIDEIEKQKMVAYEKELDSQRAKMQYLSLQLKPHFYLNGLKTLNVMAMNNDMKKIQDVIIHLSRHLRYLLNVEKELVPLQSEIDYVNNYVLLQQEMIDRPIKIEWQVNVNRKDWQIPNLCMQTFVENSFKYVKMGNTNSEVIVYISVNELESENGPILDLYIRDNGEGYPEDTLETINCEPTEGSSHVGINNLLRRCRLIYSNDFEWIFENDNGAVSNLFLPFK